MSRSAVARILTYSDSEGDDDDGEEPLKARPPPELPEARKAGKTDGNVLGAAHWIGFGWLQVRVHHTWINLLVVRPMNQDHPGRTPLLKQSAIAMGAELCMTMRPPLHHLPTGEGRDVLKD